MTSELDQDVVQERLRVVAPEGWRVGIVQVEYSWEPRPGYPSTIYVVDVVAGRPAGTRGGYVVGRMADVSLRAASVDALVDAVRALTGFDFIFSLPLDTEVSLDTHDD